MQPTGVRDALRYLIALPAKQRLHSRSDFLGLIVAQTPRTEAHNAGADPRRIRMNAWVAPFKFQTQLHRGFGRVICEMKLDFGDKAAGDLHASMFDACERGLETLHQTLKAPGAALVAFGGKAVQRNQKSNDGLFAY